MGDFDYHFDTPALYPQDAVDDFSKEASEVLGHLAGQPYAVVGSGHFRWTTAGILELIEHGNADAYAISLEETGIGASRNNILPVKYDDPEVGKKIANLYLRGFGKQLRGGR